ncbi:MAG: class I SAM-dependent methyltransferase [Gemmatimonadota bacterium]|nr:class I SAM-dependent methyltransferase [Gemmatimonadota bacterium]
MGTTRESGIQLRPTKCAICGLEGGATELYQANFTLDAFTPEVFSARRIPDRVHYRMVRCDTCSLIRSDPIAVAQLLDHLYAQSSFDYDSEISNLKRTYARYLARLEPHLSSGKGSLLEIGCGNGFFLEEAVSHGYKEVWGVEPSSAAVELAPPMIRDRIIRDVMRPDLFEPERFDVVCLFQVFDHIPDPVALLDSCRRLLKPRGLVLFLNHNVDSLSFRLLGRRNPIVDIEHTYLYSPTTLGTLVSRHGFTTSEAGRVFNTYSLQYLSQLLPLPQRLKSVVLDVMRRSRAGRVTLSVPLGNLYVIARRTDDTRATISA